MGTINQEPTESLSTIDSYTNYGLIRGQGQDNVWLYARIPWTESLLDGATNTQRIQAASTLRRFFDGLARLITPSMNEYRHLAQNQYRQFHLLTTNMPEPYTIPESMRGTRLGAWMQTSYLGEHTRKRMSIIGVKLHAGGTIKNSVKNEVKPTLLRRAMKLLDGLAANIATGTIPYEEYLDDARLIGDIMTDAGLEPFSQKNPDGSWLADQMLTPMRSWWVPKTNSFSLPIIYENTHLHIFPDVDSAAQAQRLYQNHVPCDHWRIGVEYPATLFAITKSSMLHRAIENPNNLWIGQLMASSLAGGSDALAVSVRGIVEPGRITGKQIESNARSLTKTMNDRARRGFDVKGPMQEHARKLDYMKAIYQMDDMPSTLIKLSAIIAVPGLPEQAERSITVSDSMTFTRFETSKQNLVMFDSMQPCSLLRVMPAELNWSSNMVAGAGVSSMAHAGDIDPCKNHGWETRKQGALLGFTETDRQPVYIATNTAATEDIEPIFVILGKTGSGKTMCLLNLAFQWSRIPAPDGSMTSVVLINPKEGSDFANPVKTAGGVVYNMDSDLSNGIFDPMNVLADREDAKNTASIMLADILDPRSEHPETQIAINEILDYGMSHGAACCGTAITTACQAAQESRKTGVASSLPDDTENICRNIIHLVETNQTMSLIFGTNNRMMKLRAASGLTLIQAGARSMVPDNANGTDVISRIQQWVLKMTVMGAGAAVRDRDGIVVLDEAWIALQGDSASTVSQWGRLARSQHFMPVLASQKVQEFIDAGLAGAVSRGLLLSLDNAMETDGNTSNAKAALRLFNIDPTEQTRIVSRMPQAASLHNGQPNWSSMRALRDPRTGEVVRGAIAYFIDQGDSPVGVEIKLPDAFFKAISTNENDMAARETKQGRQE